MESEKDFAKTGRSRHGGDEYDNDATDRLLDSSEKNTRWERPVPWYQLKRSVAVYAAVFVVQLVLIVGLGVMLSRARAELRGQMLYSPANEAIDWSVQEFNSGNGLHGDFIGPPRPALEKAWGELLGPMNLRLSKQDIAAYNREDSAVALSDGSGYAGSLNVYHELHCVRWLHKYVWNDKYWPDADAETKRKNRSHSDHCINTLRKFAMCHGDVGPVIYSWQPGILKPGANGTAHQCVSWPRLSQWANERAINIFKPGLIVNPELGRCRSC
ncbi:hypothetical protein LZ30DRAFT_592615 [Colletotrichum cereale]|nr:hypothetical protein LZ30DRAFT_592615 [Colletotrichum cereale]